MNRRIRQHFQHRLLSVAALLLAHQAISGVGQENLVDLPSFRTGCQALLDERFGSAIEAFRATWDQSVEAGAGDIEKDFIASRLLESFVRNGETRSAVDWIHGHPLNGSSPETTRWKALAFYTEGRYAEAAIQFSVLQNAIQELPADLLLAFADSHSRSGKIDLAFELIADLPPAQNLSDSVQITSILARAGKFEKALGILVEPGETTDEALELTHLRLKTSLLLRLNRGDEAIALLLENIETAQSEQEALTGLLLLESARVSSEYPPLQSHLGDWSENLDHPASSAARFFSPLLLDPDSDQKDHLKFYAEQKESPLLQAEATLRLRSAAPSTEEDFLATAPVSVAGGEVRTAFEQAASQFRSQNFKEAAENLSRLASRQTGENRTRSLYNAAIGFLQAGNLEKFREQKQLLRSENSKSEVLGDLEYIEGLTLAAKADGQAAILLKSFAQEYPEHPSQIDALLALAEFHLNQAPARPQAAREIFKDLRTRPLSIEQNERFDYATLWLELVEGNTPRFRSAAGRFLADWPNSKYRPEVSMLLGRALYAARDFNEASSLFHSVTTDHPDSPFAPVAQFFEIKATSDPLEAEKGWERLIEESPQFALHARSELGLLHLTEGRFKAARDQFQAIVDLAELDNLLRFAAMGDIGYTYYRQAVLSGSPDEFLEQASEAFAKLVQQSNAPEKWIYEAAVRRGKCLEMLEKPSVALEIYESIVQRSRERTPLAASSQSPEATLWVFRAGFAAIEILTREKKWEAAIQIADALSREDGPRAIKASRLAERMRLENWIWD